MKYYLSGTLHILQNLMSTFIGRTGNSFIHQLALTSVQMIAAIPNAPLIDSSLAEVQIPFIRFFFTENLKLCQLFSVSVVF